MLDWMIKEAYRRHKEEVQHRGLATLDVRTCLKAENQKRIAEPNSGFPVVGSKINLDYFQVLIFANPSKIEKVSRFDFHKMNY